LPKCTTDLFFGTHLGEHPEVKIRLIVRGFAWFEQFPKHVSGTDDVGGLSRESETDRLD